MRIRAKVLVSVLDDRSHVTFVNSKDLQYMGRYSLQGEANSGNEQVAHIGKLAMNMIFHTKSKVGFARYTDATKQQAAQLQTSFCPLGVPTYSIQSVVPDSKVQSIIYITTQKGDIVIMEVINNKGDQIECKLRGRLLNQTDSAIDHANGILYITNQHDGQVSIHQAHDVDALLTIHSTGLVLREPLNDEESTKFNLAAAGNHLIIQTSKSELLIIESMYTLQKSQAVFASGGLSPAALNSKTQNGAGWFDWLDWNTMRNLVLLCSFGGVGLYQYFKFQGRKREQDELKAKKASMALASRQQKQEVPSASSSQKMTPNVREEIREQMSHLGQSGESIQKLMNEMQEMNKKTNAISSTLGGLQKNLSTMKDSRSSGPQQRDIFDDSEEED
ncbi:hypothetical protein FGO68_gene2125 [Halteria grandinella]|uniref:Uncharacterized protein n=1 Tax=Halteria grandinella TaxID=5974 RepID=A0A8J8NUF1_HALGN|nr:hypothetical protein FGO68_gene2125 [Halteria grandinella]